VDGQQRLRTVLSFIKDGFKIIKAHHEEFGGKYFSDLDEAIQGDILKYEFVVDLLQDMPDNEVYDLFARINTYSEKLTPQELRNARWFGEFKSSVYLLAKDFVTFFEADKVFTPKQILRVSEAEFVSDLLLAIQEGIRAGEKHIIDNAYKNYDDEFLDRKLHERHFRETMDVIGGILGDDLPQSVFRATRLLYPLFCAVFHLKFGIPNFTKAKVSLKVTEYPKLKMALEKIDELIGKIETGKKNNENIPLSPEDRKFYDA
jgi:hypothetical protein